MNDYTAFYILTKDDFCLRESCQALKAQGVEKFFFCMPKAYWDGTPLNTDDIRIVTQIAHEFGTEVVSVPVPSDPRMSAKEAIVRNYCLDRIGGHVLIVDGDEWWRAGALKELDDHIRDNESGTTTIQATSVVGVPGYPVGGYQEGLLVHVDVDSGARFKCSRSTDILPSPCSFAGVYHFTATRKSVREIMVKNRRSSHYDDPDYAFDDWNANVLPHLKPGKKDCHMFKGWQIWPEIRNFTEEEWNEIPSSLKQHLGKPQ